MDSHSSSTMVPPRSPAGYEHAEYDHGDAGGHRHSYAYDWGHAHPQDYVAGTSGFDEGPGRHPMYPRFRYPEHAVGSHHDGYGMSGMSVSHDRRRRADDSAGDVDSVASSGSQDRAIDADEGGNIRGPSGVADFGLAEAGTEGMGDGAASMGMEQHSMAMLALSGAINGVGGMVPRGMNMAGASVGGPMEMSGAGSNSAGITEEGRPEYGDGRDVERESDVGRESGIDVGPRDTRSLSAGALDFDHQSHQAVPKRRRTVGSSPMSRQPHGGSGGMNGSHANGAVDPSVSALNVLYTATTATSAAEARLCRHPHCRRGPSYGLDGDKRATYCARHHLPGMVNVVSPRCAHPDCRLGPSYNRPGERKGEYCAGHRLPGMVNVVSPRCQHPECGKGPSYGHVGDRKASFCARHRVEGMINVVSPRCKEQGCSRGPSFGYDDVKRAIFCAKHKQKGMVNVVSPRCRHPECYRGPSYGVPGDRRPSFCAKHKLEGMVNVISRKCAEAGCRKSPSFGQTGDRKPTYCAAHKDDTMVNIISGLQQSKAE